MNNDIENLNKTLHSIQFAISDLREVVKTNNLLLVELVMTSLETLNKEAAKIKNLIFILEGELPHESKGNWIMANLRLSISIDPFSVVVKRVQFLMANNATLYQMNCASDEVKNGLESIAENMGSMCREFHITSKAGRKSKGKLYRIAISDDAQHIIDEFDLKLHHLINSPI